MKKDVDSTKVMATMSIPVVVSTSLGYSGRGVFPLKLSSTKETADKLIDTATDIYANEKKNPVILTMYDTAYGGVIDLPLYINIFPKEFGLCSIAVTPYLQEYLDDTSDYVPTHKLYDVKASSRTEAHSLVKSSSEFIAKYMLDLNKEELPFISAQGYGVVEIDGITLWIMNMRSSDKDMRIISSSGAATPLNPELSESEIKELTTKAIKLALAKKLILRVPYNKDIHAIDTKYHCGLENVVDVVSGMLVTVEDIDLAGNKILKRVIRKISF